MPGTAILPPPSIDSKSTTCAVVGGGPAGTVLALLLARQGIDVTLLESHNDFDRDFRGDTVHPSTMEAMAQIGLAEKVLAVANGKIQKFNFMTPEGPVLMADLSTLKSPFPYIAMVSQADFLNILVAEAGRFPNFHLHMGASAQELIVEGEAVRGVRYRAADGWHDLQATLTVGTDGRASRIRHVAGFEQVKSSPPMDVLWFRLPRLAGDENDASTGVRFSHGNLLVMIHRGDHWQLGYVILKGGYKAVHDAGIEAFQKLVGELVPFFAERIKTFTAWNQIALLSVESGCLELWHKPGLLLIGDAAHVMSPVGGVGINYAIQDAIATANELTEPLQTGTMDESHLAAIQTRRRPAVHKIQAFQGMVQKRIIARALQNDAFTLPLPLRIISKIPFLRSLPARFLAYGPCPERIRHVVEHSAS